MWEGLPFHPPHHRKLSNWWRPEQQRSGQPGMHETMFQKAKPKANRKSCPMVYFFLSSLPLSSPPFLHFSFTFSPPLLTSFFLSNQGWFWTLGNPAASAYGVLRSQLYTVLPGSHLPHCHLFFARILTGLWYFVFALFLFLLPFLLKSGPLPPCFLSSSLSLSPPPCVLPVLSRCQVFNLLACLSFIDLFLTHRCLPAPGWLSVPEPRQRWNILAAACLDGCQLITSPGDRGRSCFPSSRMEHGGAE